MSTAFMPPTPERPEAHSRPTLEGLLEKSGRRDVPDDLLPALRLAVAAHAQRLRDERADREVLNRSTALWALLATNAEVSLAVAEGDLDVEALRSVLGITVDPRALPAESLPQPLALDDSLARALDEQLGGVDPIHLDVLEVTTAILRSCLKPGGLLPHRLDQLRVDRSAALDALDRMRAGRVFGLSRTVRLARQDLGPDQEVTAAEVVAALGKLHAESPAARIEAASVGGVVAATDWWLSQARALYDATDLLHSDRRVMDMELTVRALVDLEPALARWLEGDTKLMKWAEGIRPMPSAERYTEPSVDAPAEVDLLGRATLAKTLLKQLEVVGRRGENSMLIHLDGPWGSGKSSLFVFLEKAIREAEDGIYLVVKVNAWREQRVGAQWWTLYRALRAAHLSAADSWYSRVGSRLGHLWDVIVVRRDKLWPVLLSVAVIALGLWLVLWFGIGVEDVGLPEILSIAAVVTTALTGAYRFLVPVSPRSARAMVETSTNPMAEVRDLFARSVHRAGPRRVMFLIDDLDRCEPDYVIRFLEVVQTLVRDAPCDGELRARRGRSRQPGVKRLGPYAVVAADGGWLRSSYEKAYGELVHDDVPGKPLGYRFLEKIFQMHIRLPSVEKETKQRYYASLLFPQGGGSVRPTARDEQLQEDVTSQISSVRTTEDLSALNESISRISDPVTRQSLRSTALEHATAPAMLQRQLHELNPFAELLESNPRTIRLFVNAVSMQAYVRFLEGASFELSSLALWAVLEARWPALADHLRDHPRDVQITSPHSGDQGHLSPALLDLLTGPEVGSVLRNPRWGRFTPERIRACTGGGLLTTRP